MSKNVSPITKETSKTPARMLSPFEEMERMFEQFLHRDLMSPLDWRTPAWSRLSAPFAGKMPTVDVVDRDNEILIRAELPGGMVCFARSRTPGSGTGPQADSQQCRAGRANGRGAYLQTLDQNQPYQIIRIKLPANAGYYPEVSGGRHRFTIRFLAC